MSQVSNQSLPKKYQDMIQTISKDFVSAKPLSLPALFGQWITLSVMSGILGIYYFHHRPDLAAQLQSFSFYKFSILLVVGLTLCMYGIVLSGIPGQGRPSSRFLSMGTLVSLLWILAYAIPIVLTILTTAHVSVDAGLMCSVRVVLLSLIPLGISLFFIRKLSPTRLIRSGIGIFGIATLLGNFFMTYICPAADPTHIFVWHILPIALMSGIGAVTGSKLLKW